MSVLLVALAVAVFSAPAKEDTDQIFGFLSPTNNGIYNDICVYI